MREFEESESGPSDAELLEDYRRTQSEPAFCRLVQRHVAMVYGVALRRTGDPQWAEEICQTVFAQLARKSGRLVSHPCLCGWLYRAATHESTFAWRREYQRRRKVREAMAQARFDNEGRDLLANAKSLLDEAMGDLPDADRHVLLLRFFQKMKFREIGKQVGKSEEAVRKQTDRALEKLSGILIRKGAAISLAAAGTFLIASGSKAAPPMLTQSILQSTLTIAKPSSISAAINCGIHAMTTSKQIAATAAICLGLATIPIAYQWRDNHMLRVHIAELDESDSRQSPESPQEEAKQEQAEQESFAPITIDLIADLLVRLRQMGGGSRLESGGRWEVLAEVARLNEQAVWPVFELMKQMPRLMNDEQLLSSLFDRWGELNPIEAYAQAESIWPSAARPALSAALVHLVQADEQAAMAALERLKSRREIIHDLSEATVYSEVVSDLLGHLALTDLDHALGWLEMVEETDSFGVKTKVIQRLSNKDPQAAMGWLQATMESGQWQFGLHTIMKDFAQFDPRQAIDFALWVPDAHRAYAVNAVLDVWFEKDPEGALDFSMSLPSGLDIADLGTGLASGIARMDPITIETFVEKLPEHAQAAVIASIFGERVKRNTTPAFNANLTLSMPAGGARKWAVQTAAAAWARSEFMEAAQWAESLSESADRESAAAGIANAIAHTDPETAVAWAETISGDPLLRQSTLEKIRERWKSAGTSDND